MEPFFDDQVKGLYESACTIISGFLKDQRKEDHVKIDIPPAFQKEFFSLADKVNLRLLEDKETPFDALHGYQ